MQRPNPWTEIAVTILVPSVLLMQGNAWFGNIGTLLLALAFPLGWGLWQAWHKRGFGLMAGIGVISTLLTGGIGLLQLDAQWLAVKEAAVPAALGLAVAISAATPRPLIHALVLHPGFFEVEKVQAALTARGTQAAFDSLLRRATLWLASTFAFSALANYALARWIVNSPAGSEAFNQELGRLTLWSYPVIALPSLLMTMALLVWMSRHATALTGLTVDQIMVGAPPPPQRQA